MSMGFFTTRDRAEPGKSVEPRVEGRVRDGARRDFAPPRRRVAEPDLTGHVGVLMQRVTESSLQEIDGLIARLQQRREQLLDENDRVQRQIIAFAQMSQSTMQSTKIISESLAHFIKLPDAPPLGALEADSAAGDVAAGDRVLSDEQLRGDGDQRACETNAVTDTQPAPAHDERSEEASAVSMGEAAGSSELETAAAIESARPQSA
jgi:hypothetical protein